MKIKLLIRHLQLTELMSNPMLIKKEEDQLANVYYGIIVIKNNYLNWQKLVL